MYSRTLAALATANGAFAAIAVLAVDNSLDADELERLKERQDRRAAGHAAAAFAELPGNDAGQ
jgi:hypothetical protein